MAKSKADIVRVRKLQFNAGQAKPGPALAGVGINMPEFTRAFNDATRDRGNEPVPVQITVYNDKSFEFKLFTSPASYKLKQAAKIESGSSNAKTTKVATITVDQLREIAQYKLPRLKYWWCRSCNGNYCWYSKKHGNFNWWLWRRQS